MRATAARHKQKKDTERALSIEMLQLASLLSALPAARSDVQGQRLRSLAGLGGPGGLASAVFSSPRGHEGPLTGDSGHDLNLRSAESNVEEFPWGDRLKIEVSCTLFESKL